jgi:hypothetical protein
MTFGETVGILVGVVVNGPRATGQACHLVEHDLADNVLGGGGVGMAVCDVADPKRSGATRP